MDTPCERKGSKFRRSKGFKGVWRAPLKVRGASLYKTYTTALTGEGKTSQPRLWRVGNAFPPLVADATTFPPQAGAQQPVLTIEKLFEVNVYRSFIVPPLLRGEGGAVGTKGGKLWRSCIGPPSQPKLASSLPNKRPSFWSADRGRWLITVMQIMLMNLKGISRTQLTASC